MLKMPDKDPLVAINEYLKNHLDALSDRQAGRILRGLHTACIQHDGQTRRSGGPFLIHAIAVAQLVRDFGLSIDGQVAALIHDTIEDGRMTRNWANKAFGSRVALIVHALTKHAGQSDQDYFNQIVEASAKFWEIMVVKVLDRYHNLTDPYGGNVEREQRMLSETLGVFQEACRKCRACVPRKQRTDYDDLVDEVINLANQRLREIEPQLTIASP